MPTKAHQPSDNNAFFYHDSISVLLMQMSATHHLPNKVRANHLNPGFVIHVRESLTLQCHGTSRH